MDWFISHFGGMLFNFVSLLGGIGFLTAVIFTVEDILHAREQAVLQKAEQRSPVSRK